MNILWGKGIIQHGIYVGVNGNTKSPPIIISILNLKNSGRSEKKGKTLLLEQ